MTALQQLHAALPLWAWLVVDAAACYRLTRLVTRDSLPPVRAARDAVQRRWGDRALGELVVCPWCVSVWLAAGVLAAQLWAPVAWCPAAVALSWSAAAGLISERE